MCAFGIPSGKRFFLSHSVGRICRKPCDLIGLVCLEGDCDLAVLIYCRVCRSFAVKLSRITAGKRDACRSSQLDLEREVLILSRGACDLLFEFQITIGGLLILDLHGIPIAVINKISITDLRHIIGQLKNIRKADLFIAFRRFCFLDEIVVFRMILVIIVELIPSACHITVESNDAVLGRKCQLLRIGRRSIRAKIHIGIITGDLELCAVQLLVCIKLIDFYNSEINKTAGTLSISKIIFFVRNLLLLILNTHRVLDLQLFVSRRITNDQGTVLNSDLCLIGYRIGDNCCSSVSAACNIRNRSSLRISRNFHRVVIQAQVCAEHIRHGKRLTAVQCCLDRVKGDPVPGSAVCDRLASDCLISQFICIQQFFVEIVISRLISTGRLVISPFRGIDNVIFSAV